MDKFTKLFGAVWVAGLLFSVAIWGVVIWAVVKLVNHFAG